MEQMKALANIAHSEEMKKKHLCLKKNCGVHMDIVNKETQFLETIERMNQMIEKKRNKDFDIDELVRMTTDLMEVAIEYTEMKTKKKYYMCALNKCKMEIVDLEIKTNKVMLDSFREQKGKLDKAMKLMQKKKT